ncbi:MAG: choice-of-anchor Q domain-containing protein [Bryobacteraceae bacterium]
MSWGQVPRAFFTDIESGPATGGENNQGVFVTIWGRNFGPTRGASRVTMGGGSVVAYPVWTDTRITVQLGEAARSGGLVITTTAGTSNALPFTVRSGGIYFVATSGNDANDGSFARPWRTILKAKNSMRAGDTTYVRDGVEQIAEEGFDAAVNIQTGGEAGRPIALIAYPGARATIGSPALEYGLRIPNIDEAAGADHWVLSQLRFRASGSAIAIQGPNPSYWKLTGNDISCPGGDGPTGCFVSSLATYLRFLGNEVHGTGRRGASKQYHAVYFSTDSNHVEAAWNNIHDNNTCRAIQVHSSPLTEDNTNGLNQYDLIIHGNLIRGDACDGIVLATVDPSKGRVEVYNNVIIRAGAGPHPPDDPASYSCVFVPGYTNAGPDGRGTVEIYNNTCYDFASVEPDFFGEAAWARDEYSTQLFMNLRNNISYAVARRAYVRGPENLIRGSNNLWFGNGPGPAFLQGNINADPLFAAPASFDLRLRSVSPAIDAGAATGLTSDFDGAPRPQGRAIDIGAFEFGSTTTPPPPSGQRPQISANGIADVFSGLGFSFAPGQLVSIFGLNLGPMDGIATQFDSATNRLPTRVAGTSVTWAGIAAPLLYVSSGQINVQVPYEAAGLTQADVVVTAGGASSEARRVAMQPTRPNLFPRAFHADFSFIERQSPATAGEIIVLFATGQGLTVPRSVTGATPGSVLPVPEASVEVTIGGVSAEVLFRGQTPGTAGLMQLNLRVPSGVAGESVAVALRVGGVQSTVVPQIAVR